MSPALVIQWAFLGGCATKQLWKLGAPSTACSAPLHLVRTSAMTSQSMAPFYTLQGSKRRDPPLKRPIDSFFPSSGMLSVLHVQLILGTLERYRRAGSRVPALDGAVSYCTDKRLTTQHERQTQSMKLIGGIVFQPSARGRSHLQTQEHPTLFRP